MCGGFDAARQDAQKKDAMIEKELKRLGRLENGRVYTWPFSTGLEKYPFGGYCRSENLDSTWAGKIERHVKIPVDTFYERNTKDKTYKFHAFKVGKDKALHAVVTKQGEVRIVTQAANGEVAKIHSRSPHLVNIDGAIEKVKEKVTVIEL